MAKSLRGIAFPPPTYTVPDTTGSGLFGGVAEDLVNGTGLSTGMDHRAHIVVVEDEAAQRQLLVDYLAKQNFRVSSADGGTALRKLLERELPALVLLDIGLPGEDGFVLARWLRERSGRIGIIMVTAAADTVDRVVGLETGADDYIAKPFEPRELLARVKSVLRRSTRRDRQHRSARAHGPPRARPGKARADRSDVGAARRRWRRASSIS